jgi:TonB family protein
MKNSAYVTLLLPVVLVVAFSITPASDQSSICDPVVLSAIAPNHPQIAKAANAYGEITVEVRIDENGRVDSASAVSGHELLRTVSENAAKQWLFAPAKDGSKGRTSSLTFAFQRIDEKDRKFAETVVAFMPPHRVEVRYHPSSVPIH